RPDNPWFNGPRPDNPRFDGPRPDGPRPEGPRTDGPRMRGPRVERPEWWQQPDRFVERFERDTAGVSHELNTPVTAVRGYIETLTMPELQLDGTTRTRYLGIIGDEAARLERLIGELLDLATLEGGGGTLRREPVKI